jgi:heme exporter protein D
MRTMMNQANGPMGGWWGGGMWVWSTVGIGVVVLLVVVIGRLLRK